MEIIEILESIKENVRNIARVPHIEVVVQDQLDTVIRALEENQVYIEARPPP